MSENAHSERPTAAPVPAKTVSILRKPAPTPGVEVPRARLTTLYGVRTHLAWVVQSLEAGTLAPNVGNALTVALNALAGLIESTDVLDRIAKLEKAMRQ